MVSSTLDLTAVIPARLGSSRVKYKVLQEVSSGESLLERKVKQLKKVLPSSNIVVNTESEIIGDIAYRQGVEVCYRDEYYARGHEATFSEVIMHVIAPIESEHIAWVPCVVPFFDEVELGESFEAYDAQVVHGNFDSLISVVTFKEYLWNDRSPLNYVATKDHTISQLLPDWHKVTNGNYMAPKTVMEKYEYLLGERPFLDVRSPKCGVDIDTLNDLNVARAMVKILDV